MIEEKIIKLFCENRDFFEKYYPFLNLEHLRHNYKEHSKALEVVKRFYTKFDEAKTLNREDFETAYATEYLLKDAERKDVASYLDRVLTTEVNEELIKDYLEQHRRRALAGQIARVALEVEDGKESDELVGLLAKFENEEVQTLDAKPVNMNLEELYDSQVATQGLRWRVNWLNHSLGSLRKGDFGFIFARPETGKTTFLASECTHMVSQTEGEILWFNNEEQGNKVAIRCYQAMLGVQTQALWQNKQLCQERFEKDGGDRIKIFDFEDSSHRARIEEILKLSNPALIIFDQIDKIKGFKGERNDLELKAIYQWARELAKTYAPVIAVSQASGEAEGKLYLTMDMVDGSKTAKQGEADWILGIGKEQDNTSTTRFFNITKNKLIGDIDTRPDLRHGSTQVIIKPEIARYVDT